MTYNKAYQKRPYPFLFTACNGSLRKVTIALNTWQFNMSANLSMRRHAAR